MSRASTVPTSSAAAILVGCRCGRAGCDCQRPAGKVHCPAHDDDYPSLSVTEQGGKVLLRCRAGCEQDRVIEALRQHGLWSQPSTNGRTRETIHAYHDAAGAVVFETVRREDATGKHIYQRRPDGKGGHISNLQGVELVPYRLPQLLAAPPGTVIYIAEGEKCADRLSREGLVATTNALGAGAWRAEYAKSFVSRDVVILPDNDEPGRDHALQVAKALYGTAKSIRIVELPNLPAKGDIVDFLAAGHDRDELLEHVAVTPVWGPAQVGDDGDTTAPAGARRGPTQATLLVRLTEDAELFHDAESAGYATATVGGITQTWPLRSTAARSWLTRQYYQQYQAAPSAQAVEEALRVLEAQAQFDGAERAVSVRVAGDRDHVYIDLGDSAWRVVEIDAAGWRVRASKDVPVRFRRPKGTLALPAPMPGGSLDELRRFLNSGSGDNWALIVGWLVQALAPSGPYLVLDFEGRQGSAKSTTCRVLRRLLDPNTADLRAEPREQRDLVIAATNSWIVAFDNISHLPPWLSDGMCRLATGGGYATRTLYANREEELFDATRPQLVNGIAGVVTASDLLDRTLLVELPFIPEEQRKAEAHFWRDFEATRPRILGVLYDAVALALRNRPTTSLPRLNRMADAELWITAAEPALGWEQGTFHAAYARSRGEADQVALDASPLTPHLLRLAEAGFEGPAQELLSRLSALAPEDVQRSKGWPRNPAWLAKALKLLAPNLRTAGIEYTYAKSEKGKIHTLRMKAEFTDHTDHTDQPTPRSTPFSPDGTDQPRGFTDQPGGVTDQPERPVHAYADGMVGTDGKFPDLSNAAAVVARVCYWCKAPAPSGRQCGPRWVGRCCLARESLRFADDDDAEVVL